ncbi:MAG: alpha/beta hydrolase [Candidatus Micrarchaeota archaeon]|nr:alpha/beta hydrolase [Candidatus Micrarchaeota archaeon]
MNVLIVHCWGCDCESNWFPWLKTQLEARGSKVVCPNLPNSELPNLNEWLAEIRKTVSRFNKDWILVGHSLGCPTILRLLETFDKEEKINAVILVSGFARDVGYNEMKSFIDSSFDWEKIKKTAKQFIVVHSRDDELIRFEEGEYLAKQLHAKFIVEQGLGHIRGEPYGRYERVLEIILSLTK